LNFRKPLKITSRTSSITNSFVQAIIPSVEPTEAEVDEALAVMDMTRDRISCIYCGAPASDWDHLRPLVRARRPTGYINEIRNLVPSCGRCNQSKSGADWRAWMLGTARGSPTSRGVADVQDRVERLQRFEDWGDVQPLALRDLAGAEEWDAYWANLEIIESQMREAQRHATRIQPAIRAALDKAGKSEVVFGGKQVLADG
jgi:hypothetical protein